MSFSSYQDFNHISSSIFSPFLNTINYFIASVLRVLLGGLAPLLLLLDLNRSQMGWPRVSAVLDTCLPMATMRPAFGGSSHGVCEVGVPSPGDQASWGEKKTGEKKEAAGLKSPVFSMFDGKIRETKPKNTPKNQ